MWGIIIPMSDRINHGGQRVGAGRPRGVPNRRSQQLFDEILLAGKCPAQALVRIAERAESEGKLALAIDAWKAVLPFVHAKPKAVELDPEAVVGLTRSMTEARYLSRQSSDNSYGQRLESAIKKIEACTK
jgi:hypothetical protein